MLKKVAALALAISLVVTVGLAGCGKTESKDAFDKIKEKGAFVVGLDDAFPPMGFRDDKNNIVGFDIDLAKEAAKRMGLEVKFQPVVWDTVIEELNSGKIDLIWNGLTITDERKAKINFTKPYISDRQILVVTKDSTITGKADLAGKVVGVQAGSSSVEALKKDEATYKSLKETKEYQSNDLALLDLKAKRVDAVVVDEVVGRYYISKHIDDYKVLNDSFAQEDFGVGVRKSDTKFLQDLEKAIDAMKADGTASKISKQWFGDDIIKK